MALTGVVGFTVLFNYALLYGSASQGALIFAFAPAAIALGAVLVLAESPSKRRVAGIVASVLGVVLVVAGGEATAQARSPLLGGLCMIGSVASWTVYTVLAKGLAKADQIVVTALVSVAGALLLLPGAAIELALGPWPQVSLQGWLGTVFLGLIASALTYVVYGRALRELDASLVGVFSNLDPIVGVLTAVLLLDERLYAGQMLGGAITLFGMWLASSRQGEAPPSRSV